MITLSWLLVIGLVGAILLLGVLAFGMRDLATSGRSRIQVWALLTAGYGAIISLVNPTLQSPGLAFVLLSVLIISADTHPRRSKTPGEELLPSTSAHQS